MKGLLHADQVNGLPAMQEWMRHASDVRHRIMRDHSNAPDEEKLRLITEYNVLAQIENLRSHPSVQSRVTSGEVEIRGWVYDIGDGSIWSADPESGSFKRIGDTKPE
jgi:carbonic anhydrase